MKLQAFTPHLKIRVNDQAQPRLGRNRIQSQWRPAQASVRSNWLAGRLAVPVLLLDGDILSVGTRLWNG